MEKLATITILSTILFSNECIVNINLKAKDKSTTTINIENKKECIINLKIDDLISIDTPINFDSNDTITNIISLAKSKLGSKYESTKAGPDSFDCSGFIYFIFSSNKIDIPRSSKEQSEMEGKQLTKDELEIGDLVFFDTSKKNHVNHSGLYIGDGNFIHSSSGKAYGVTISNLITGWYKDKFLWGIRKKI
jgi:cell wall-associated NlpC family hydrolase